MLYPTPHVGCEACELAFYKQASPSGAQRVLGSVMRDTSQIIMKCFLMLKISTI